MSNHPGTRKVKKVVCVTFDVFWKQLLRTLNPDIIKYRGVE